jgi:hypothetical protein
MLSLSALRLCVLLGAGILSVLTLLPIFWTVLVLWLGGSFGFLSVSLCFDKNKNVPPNGLATSALSV